MNVTYRNAIANHGASLITHIGLVDEVGDEIAGGSYARQAVTWTSADDGIIRPNANLVFDIPESTTVAGWKGFSASTGGTDYDGKDLTNETFNASGTYTLVASGTGILHNTPA